MKQPKISVNMVSESDISVQGHGVHTAYVEMTRALKKRCDVRVITGEFGRQVECDIVHLHTIGTSVWLKLRQKGPVKVISAHIVPASFIGSIALAKYWRFAARWYMKLIYNKADKVLAVSGMVAESLKNELGVPASKIEVLYNSIDMSEFSPSPKKRQQARRRLGIDKAQLVVVGNGQVQPRKRIDTFVAMAKAHPEVRFIWIGGIPFKQLGADYHAMRRLMDSAPSNLTFTDVIPREEVGAYYDAADIFCLPAEQENHPMCVLEAAGAELPIVLRDIPEYNDTFADDALRCSSDEDFIKAIDTLKDAKARQVWHERSMKIRDRFDSQAMMDRVVEIYQGLLAAQTGK